MISPLLFAFLFYLSHSTFPAFSAKSPCRTSDETTDIAAKNASDGAAARSYELRGENSEVTDNTIVGRVDEKGEARFALDVVFPGWDENTYVMLPGGAYDGNRAYLAHTNESHHILFDRR